jgi:transposase
LNIVVEVAEANVRPVRSGIGIDLGLKDFAALSTGEKIENPRLLRQRADQLATAQRARKRRQATTSTRALPMRGATFTTSSRPASFENSITSRSAM